MSLQEKCLHKNLMQLTNASHVIYSFKQLASQTLNTHIPLYKPNAMQCFQTDPDDEALVFQVQYYPSDKL